MSTDYDWDSDGGNRISEMLQEAIFGSTWTPPEPASMLTAEGLVRALEAVADHSTLGPYDAWPGSETNPVHPADAEAARVWHGLPEGAIVTRQQYWEWLVGVPRT